MQQWLERHPRVNAWLNGIADAFHYVFTGGWIVDLVRWMIDTGGNIAESAFILATVYVTLNTVAHLLVSWLLPERAITTLNQISIIAFSVLPELIVVSAMAVCFDHWRMVYTTRRVDAWVWAIAYSLPTLVFLAMTVYTITNFVNFEVSHMGASFIVTGPMLVIRCLAGWSYGTVRMIFVKLGKPGYTSMITGYQSELAALGDKLKDRDESITDMQTQLANLQKQVEHQGNELIEARIAVATAKVTRETQSDITRIEKATNGKVTLLRGDGDSKRQKLKRHIRGVVLAGEKLNYKQIEKDTGLSYNMIRAHAKNIVEEISSERQTDQLAAVES